MLRVVETFSGIGSQAKALKKVGRDYEILATVEWDINAIYAYDIIHNGPQDLAEYETLTKSELVKILYNYGVSCDGKNVANSRALMYMSEEGLRRIYAAIIRTKNLVNIVEVSGKDLPKEIDILTYSFPCQDLSICGAWHGNMSGIGRGVNNRSGMLWEIERILSELVKDRSSIPKILLMENVSNILSNTHRHNFQIWKDYLEELGYYNQIYTLDAKDFGVPQSRKRTFMISIYSPNEITRESVKSYFDENNLELSQRSSGANNEGLEKYLRLDYSIPKYRLEAEQSNPNRTPSREKIFKENLLIHNGIKPQQKTIKTITTKQDRHPNSGIISFMGGKGKSSYRNITPRECFLFMGFDEMDFERLIENDFIIRGDSNFLGREKLIKLAGNSIVVNVLEAVFKQINFINDNIL